MELEGPDLVVEIVSDSSVTKDTQRLPLSYWQAGVTEYWLVDVGGERLSFQIYSRRNLLWTGGGGSRGVSTVRGLRPEVSPGSPANMRGPLVFDLQSRQCDG